MRLANLVTAAALAVSGIVFVGCSNDAPNPDTRVGDSTGLNASGTYNGPPAGATNSPDGEHSSYTTPGINGGPNPTGTGAGDNVNTGIGAGTPPPARAAALAMAILAVCSLAEMERERTGAQLEPAARATLAREPERVVQADGNSCRPRKADFFISPLSLFRRGSGIGPEPS